jgi:hypothetical protein
MGEKRKRDKQSTTLRDRVAAFARDSERQAEQLPPGPQRDEAVKKARQAQIANDIDQWLNSPSLQPPKGLKSEV